MSLLAPALIASMLGCTGPGAEDEPLTGDTAPGAETEDTGASDPNGCHAPTSQIEAGVPLSSSLDPTSLGRVVRLDTVPETWAMVWYPADPLGLAYEAGAPVVVSVYPVRKLRDRERPWLRGYHGAIEVQPVYPGSSAQGLGTAGSLDLGGEASVAAIQATIAFAAGELSTIEGWGLAAVAQRPVCNGQVVVLGTSSGGEVAARALAELDPRLLDRVLGFATYESPILPQMSAGDLGMLWRDEDLTLDGDDNGYAWDDGRWQAYTPGACDATGCALPHQHILWDPRARPEAVYPHKLEGISQRGALLLDRSGDGQLTTDASGSLDLDGDGAVGLDEDFLFVPLWSPDEPDAVQRYSPQVLDAAVAAGQLELTSWPSHLARPEEVGPWWAERDLLAHLPAIAQAAHPDFAVAVAFTAVDHGVSQPTRPHIHLFYEAFRQRGVPARYNTLEEVALCLAPPHYLQGWAGELERSQEMAEGTLDPWALPETLSVPAARALASLGLIWEAWGPFERCRE